MRLILTKRAVREAKRCKTWWRKHRLAAPDAFEVEFAEALDLLLREPRAGLPYGPTKLELPVRRVLLPKSKNHVYFAVDGDTVVVLSVRGAPRGTTPKL